MYTDRRKSNILNFRIPLFLPRPFPVLSLQRNSRERLAGIWRKSMETFDSPTTRFSTVFLMLQMKLTATRVSITR